MYLPTCCRRASPHTLASKQFANSRGLTRIIPSRAIVIQRLGAYVVGNERPYATCKSSTAVASGFSCRINATTYAPYARISGEAVDFSGPSYCPVDMAARSFPSSRLLRRGSQRGGLDRLNGLTSSLRNQDLSSKSYLRVLRRASIRF
jgi:hypothetical protein